MTPGPAAPTSPPPTGPPDPQRPARSGSLVVAARAALVLAMVATVGVAVWALSVVTRPPAGEVTEIPALEVTPAKVRPGSAAPAAVAQPVPQGAPGQDPLGDWADQVAGTVDVPARALRAYAVTDLALRAEAPNCRLSWATLAGIGRVESNHGRFAGARLGSDGRPSRPIIGVPLDGGSGVREITDTDAGRLDGDERYDRAVGPMQFIPSTWARWGSDGDGDGQADPQDIDDAALAAGRYLCAGGRDTGTPQGWWAAVLSYNHSVDYGQRVFGVADTYARTTTR
jgi:membrane-bound lytic murein transglycosylase B